MNLPYKSTKLSIYLNDSVYCDFTDYGFLNIKYLMQDTLDPQDLFDGESEMVDPVETEYMQAHIQLNLLVEGELVA